MNFVSVNINFNENAIKAYFNNKDQRSSASSIVPKFNVGFFHYHNYEKNKPFEISFPHYFSVNQNNNLRDFYDFFYQLITNRNYKNTFASFYFSNFVENIGIIVEIINLVHRIREHILKLFYDDKEIIARELKEYESWLINIIWPSITYEDYNEYIKNSNKSIIALLHLTIKEKLDKIDNSVFNPSHKIHNGKKLRYFEILTRHNYFNNNNSENKELEEEKLKEEEKKLEEQKKLEEFNKEKKEMLDIIVNSWYRLPKSSQREALILFIDKVDRQTSIKLLKTLSENDSTTLSTFKYINNIYNERYEDKK